MTIENLTKEEIEVIISALEGDIGCMTEMGYHKMPNEHSGYPKFQQLEKRASFDNATSALNKIRATVA